MSGARFLPAVLLAATALFGPALTGTSRPPSIAAAAAQLLPPGTVVQEVDLVGGGFARARALEPSSEGLRVARTGEWRTVNAPPTAGGVHRVRLWLGTDQQGRDLLALVVHGARTSLATALVATLVAAVLGAALGLGAALAPAAAREALAIATDGLLGLPRLVLLMMLGVGFRGSIAGMGLAIGLASWMEIARLVEVETLRARRTAFFSAAVATGAGRTSLACRHLLPHVLPLLLVTAPLVATQAIVLEATLSFLGLAPGTTSWGRLVADGQRLLPQGWWIVLFPGALLTLTAVAVHLLARPSPRGPLASS